jgi:hypothetical protein
MEKTKSGMYGELPKRKIGDYTVCPMNNIPNETRVWIENIAFEGGEFDYEGIVPILEMQAKVNELQKEVNELMNKFWKENF